jgi:hypothetical protein
MLVGFWQDDSAWGTFFRAAADCGRIDRQQHQTNCRLQRYGASEWTEVLMNGSCRGYRGGAFSGNSDYALTAVNNSHGSPSMEDSTIGFRVASVPESSSIVLLVTGAINLLAPVRTPRIGSTLLRAKGMQWQRSLMMGHS